MQRRMASLALSLVLIVVVSACASVAPRQRPTPAAVTQDSQGGDAARDDQGQSGLSAQDAAFLKNHLDHLKYMVYVSDSTAVDEAVSRAAVSQADRYLIEKLGLAVVDYNQVESNKRDQAAAWQADTGGSVTMLQYLARKFDADVYVEIDMKVASSSAQGKWYASTQGTMRIFDPATATLLGSLSFTGQEAFSPSSLDAAVGNAVASSVWQAMPKVTEQARNLVGAAMSRGLRYELNLHHPPEAKALGDFRKALARKLRDVTQVSYSPDEARFDLYAFLPPEKVQDAIYEAGNQAGMPDLNLALMRGRSFTFDSGR